MEEIAELGLLRGVRVLELGAGCGLTGLVAAHHASMVLLTDIEPILSVLRKNVESETKLLSCKVNVNELRWGQFSADNIGDGLMLQHPFDVIIGSELIYKEPDLEPLIKTMLCMTHMSSVCLLAYRGYRPEWSDTLFARFLALLAQAGFEWYVLRKVESSVVFSFQVFFEAYSPSSKRDLFEAILAAAHTWGKQSDSWVQNNTSIFVLRRTK